jgi:hypothetical protein
MAYLSITNPGPHIIQVIKALRDVTGASLRDAKECVEGTIQLDIGEVDNYQKAHIKQHLGEHGCVKCVISKNPSTAKKPLIATAPAPKVKTWHERLLED